MTGETFRVVKSQHALSALPVLVKSEEVDVLVEGDHEQLGLDPHPIESEAVKHDMLDNPTMQLDADMFIQPLTHAPSLPPPSTSSMPSFLCPPAGVGCRNNQTPPPPSSVALSLHPLTGAEHESTDTPLLSQSMTTIDANMESDNDDMVLQALNSPTLPSPSQSYCPLMMNPFLGPSSPWCHRLYQALANAMPLLILCRTN